MPLPLYKALVAVSIYTGIPSRFILILTGNQHHYYSQVFFDPEQHYNVAMSFDDMLKVCMKPMFRSLAGILVVSLLLCASCSNTSETSATVSETTTVTTPAKTESVDVKATYAIVVDAFDWGPACNKAVLSLSRPCTEDDLCEFSVTETDPDEQKIERIVTKVYLSDAEGTPASGSSSFITIDMDVIPSGAGRIFYYNMETFRNEFSNIYRLDIRPAEGSTGLLSTLTVDPEYTGMSIPDISVFETSSYTQNDITLNYGFYTPEDSSGKHPLILWLHGQGEGGTDIEITLLGNRVTALTEDVIQDSFSGAYVLVPQCPTYWPEAVPYESTPSYQPDGTSAFTEPLMGLIEQILSENPGIDPNRIYIGGCSNGGYMTMNMLLTYPDFFAAAFPICPYYPDRLIDDEELLILKEVPLWYTYCTFDRSVNPKQHAAATIKRLQDAGATLHVSEYMDVIDTTGLYMGTNNKPFVYNSHFSWIYVLNNECKDGDLTLWDFIAAQKKA